jgi:protoporphyrin/coproporphyrin ferrochelatase
MKKKTGLLLMNLGTPDNPEPEAVGRYLKEFLMDGRVIDIAWPLRWILVNVLIVPKRKYASSHAYKTIWDERRGSPLMYHLRDLKEKVVPKATGFEIEIAMRYQNPSVEKGLKALDEKDVDEILVFPLYPQYAESSTLSSIEHVTKVADQAGIKAKIRFVNAFYEDPDFIRAYAVKLKPVLEREKPDHVVMTFHGLPVRHVKHTDRSGGRHCMAAANCCAVISEVNRDCYRAQSFATAKALAEAVGLSRDQYSVSFQSRLGRAEWIPPDTEHVIKSLAEKGMKKLAVICPSFVADCLETIEEMGERGAELFKESGGTEFHLIDCLNSDSDWAEAVVKIAEKNLAPVRAH